MAQVNILIFAALIWGACKLISACSRNAKQRQAERERERIKVEQQRIREEQARARDWQRAAEQRQREAARRQAEHDKAITRAAKERETLRREQERQAKEQERIRKEQERQAYAIRDLRYRMKVCEKDHAAIMQRLDNLRELHDIESRNIEAADRAGDDKRKAAALRKIITLDGQIAAAEKKERECRYKWNTAKQKLSA